MSTHHVPVTRMDRIVNRLVGWLTERGLSLAGSQVLTVAGRTSGRPFSTPVNPVQVDGREFLVSPRGNTQWSRNLRAVGGGELRAGRRHRDFTATQVRDDSVRIPVLRQYVRSWGWEIGRFLPISVDGASDDATYAELATLVPVFALQPR